MSLQKYVKHDEGRDICSVKGFPTRLGLSRTLPGPYYLEKLFLYCTQSQVSHQNQDFRELPTGCSGLNSIFETISIRNL